MGIPAEQVRRATEAAEARARRGYLRRAAKGDHRAGSYFARLVANDLNPTGKSDDFGTLTKPAGGSNVDGYADDAIVFGSDPNNLSNVLDLIAGAGAPGAKVGVQLKPRRPSDVWEAPKKLTREQLDYLLESQPEEEPKPEPKPEEEFPSYEAIGGDALFVGKVGAWVAEEMGQPTCRTCREEGRDPHNIEGGMNAGSATWFSRTIHSITKAFAKHRDNREADAISRKHRNEMRGVLGRPPL